MIDENKIAEAADLNADKYNPCRTPWIRKKRVAPHLRMVLNG